MTVALFTFYTQFPVGTDNGGSNNLIAESNVSSNDVIAESQQLMGDYCHYRDSRHKKPMQKPQ